jgi:hypothetical protein
MNRFNTAINSDGTVDYSESRSTLFFDRRLTERLVTKEDDDTDNLATEETES